MKTMLIWKGITLLIFIACLNLICSLSKNLNQNSQKNSLRMKEIIEIKSESDFDKLNQGRFLVYFFDNKCKMCEDLSEAIKIVEKDHEKVKIAYVNVDENPKLAKKLKINSVPLITLFENGNDIQNFPIVTKFDKK